MTDGFDNPDSERLRRMLPGALARALFEVIATTRTVEMRLSLKGLD
jgi:hypothetical protein